MAVSGTWNFYFDWGCDGSYSTTTITFNGDGTFRTGEGLTGTWVQVQGMIAWRYSGSPGTVYAGNVIGSAIAGMQTTWGGLNGCFYCTLGTRAAAAASEKAGAAGKKNSAGH